MTDVPCLTRETPLGFDEELDLCLDIFGYVDICVLKMGKTI
jgi:hypothetical protein